MGIQKILQVFVIWACPGWYYVQDRWCGVVLRQKRMLIFFLNADMRRMRVIVGKELEHHENGVE